MKMRWMLAGVAVVAAALVVTWVPGANSIFSGSTTSQRGATARQGGSCGADAPAADLSFTLEDMDGKSVKLERFKGKVVLVNFWATWCPPCKAEIPEFVEVKEQYGPKGFEILGISVDDPREALRPFAEKFRINYPVLVGLGRDDVQQAYGPIFGVPTSMLLGRDGRICQRFVGGLSKTRLERELKALL